MPSPLTQDITVLVADDQRVVREGLVGLLALTPGFSVVGAAENGQAAIELAAEHQPDIVLMDLRMPGIDGVEATRQITAARPETRVIALTTYSDDETIAAAIAAGAQGYLTKDASSEAIANGIRAVHCGAFVLDPTVGGRVVGGFVAGVVSGPTAPDSNLRLTPREIQVLKLIAAGRSNGEIADTLYVGMATVKTHVNNLFTKLDVRDRAQMVAYAYEVRLVEPPPP